VTLTSCSCTTQTPCPRGYKVNRLVHFVQPLVSIRFKSKNTVDNFSSTRLMVTDVLYSHTMNTEVPPITLAQYGIIVTNHSNLRSPLKNLVYTYIETEITRSSSSHFFTSTLLDIHNTASNHSNPQRST